MFGLRQNKGIVALRLAYLSLRPQSKDNINVIENTLAHNTSFESDFQKSVNGTKTYLHLRT